MCGGQKTALGIGSLFPLCLRLGLLDFCHCAVHTRLPRLQASRDSLVSDSHPSHQSSGIIRRELLCPTSCWSGDSNSGPHTCMVNVFPFEPSPQPLSAWYSVEYIP